MTACPCNSRHPFKSCCQPLLQGEKKASTPEQLMRSRFTAYVKEQEQYLLATWHPSTQPDGVDMTVSPEWLGLQVISHSLQGNHGIVEFKATYQDGGEIGILHETSRFIKQKNEWFYVDGDLHQPKQGKVGRNDPCPCDSGRKFKKCCR